MTNNKFYMFWHLGAILTVFKNKEVQVQHAKLGTQSPFTLLYFYLLFNDPIQGF